MIMFILALVINISSATQNWDQFIDQVTELRSNIEELAQENEQLTKTEQSQIDQLSQKKLELQAQISRENLRSKQLKDKISRLKESTKTLPSYDAQSSDLMLTWLKSYQQTIEQMIPFKQDQRLAQIQKISQRLKSQLESHESLIADLWSFLESEKKLSSTNSYQIMDININGIEQKCEVARLGLIALFAVNTNGQILQAHLRGEGWKWIDIESTDQKKSILSLVDHLKNKNTTHLYNLPINNQPLGASL